MPWYVQALGWLGGTAAGVSVLATVIGIDGPVRRPGRHRDGTECLVQRAIIESEKEE